MAEADAVFETSVLFDLPEELSGQVTAVVTGHFTDEIVTYYYTPEFNEEEMENDYLKSRFFTVQRVTPGEFEDEYNNHVTVGYLSFPGRTAPAIMCWTTPTAGWWWMMCMDMTRWRPP